MGYGGLPGWHDRVRRLGASKSVDDIERMVRHPLDLYKSLYGPS